MTSTPTDATGRSLHHGDHVGGTTSGRYQTTITGPVLQLGKTMANVLVTNRPDYTGDRPGNGEVVWLATNRLVTIHPATERRFVGFRTPDKHLWQQARTRLLLWESPTVPKRYPAAELRVLYGADLQPVWEEVPSAPAAQEPAAPVRAQAFAVATEAQQGAAYPLALPWALLMDDEDLIGFLAELAGVMQDAGHMATEAGHVHARNILAGLEKTCGTWRLIAEAQHAHNTAPGPHTEPAA
ncbi:hypothetical protein [Streptomyces sp. 049-1]|uniref:hypothetical protein n=1 Tax=Streptomyces sp. 049-1 TaxID=2789264 RepID=UPI00397FC835